MLLFLFKLLTTPLLIALATLVSRRFGESVAGWLVGLPLTSGPIALFLALDNGSVFSREAALGSLQGTSAQAFFVVAYCKAARRLPWPLALLAGALGFALCGALLWQAALGVLALSLLAVGSLTCGLWLTQSEASAPLRRSAPPWDLAARMAIAASLVVTITSVAHTVGPGASGLLATFPVFAAILGAFAHAEQGVIAATQALRGLLYGLYAFIGFFVVIHLAVVPYGIGASIAVALGVALAIQALTFLVLRRAHPGLGRS